MLFFFRAGRLFFLYRFDAFPGESRAFDLFIPFMSWNNRSYHILVVSILVFIFSGLPGRRQIGVLKAKIRLPGLNAFSILSLRVFPFL